MKRRTLALVESPAQLLNVIEWAAHHGLASDTRLLVLPPREATTRLQLSNVVEEARGAGLAATWYEPRRSAFSLVGTVWEMFPRLAKAHRLIIGDPFSRFVQAVLPLTDVPDLVVVDDGTATIGFVSQLAGGVRLSRWHLPDEGGNVVISMLSGYAREYLTPSPEQGRRVELFTAMPVAAPVGMTLTENRFEWTRRTFGPPEVRDGIDLVGTSLVETGVMGEGNYLAGVAALTAAERPGRYFAHRRESDAKLRRIAAETGLQIVRPDVPLEIVVARGPVSRTLLSFPSTVVHSLPRVLRDTGAVLRLCDVPATWLAAGAPAGAGAFLDEVARSARDRPGVA